LTVKYLTQLYIEGEDTYAIEDEDKITSVEVFRRKYVLSQEALTSFEKIHDEWELQICEKYPHDALVGGEDLQYEIDYYHLNNQSLDKLCQKK